MGESSGIPSDPSVAASAPVPATQASILVGRGKSASSWISLSSAGDLVSTSSLLAAKTSSCGSSFALPSLSGFSSLASLLSVPFVSQFFHQLLHSLWDREICQTLDLGQFGDTF